MTVPKANFCSFSTRFAVSIALNMTAIEDKDLMSIAMEERPGLMIETCCVVSFLAN